MENLITYTNYQQFKQELDTEMYKAAEGFVKIGYLLNLAATTDILKDSGYTNVNEFARAEYGIDNTQVSRFINIHKRFGVPGEARLKDQFSNHGVAKLGIMLTLPDHINEEISSGYSKSEINIIKKEIEDEQKISDIEVMCEEKDTLQQLLPEGLKQAVYQLIHDEPKLYLSMYKAITLDDLKETLAPSGECSYIIRIKGVGRLVIFMKTNEDIVITNVRDGSKSSYEWMQMFSSLKEYFAMGDDAKTSWSNVFQEAYPEEKKEEPVKVSDKPTEKVVKADKNNVEKPKKETKVKVVEPKPKKEDKTVEETLKEPEKQLPGQDSIFNHPEYLPEDMKEKEVLTGEVEDIAPDELNKNDVQQSSEGMKIEHFAPVQNVGTEHSINGLKNVIKASLHVMHDLVEKGDWPMVISKATDIVHRARKIQELEETK